MADNVTLDPGTGGSVIATDQVNANEHVQYVKLMDGTADSTAKIGGDATNGLDVDVTRVQGTVTVGDGGSSISVDDNGSTISIDDGAGSITVDGTVGVSGTVTVDSELTTADLDTGAGTDTRAVVGLVIAKSGGAANISNTDPLPIADAGGSITVDGTVTANAGTGPFPVSDNGGSLTVDNGGTFAVQDSEKIADDAAFSVASTKVMPIGFLADQVSTDSVNEGDIGAARITLDRKIITTLAPSADTEGLSISRVVWAATTNATSAKASAGKVYGWALYNDNASEVYLKLYNKASAPTVGTDTPVITFAIPAGGAANVEFAHGITFSTGIAWAVTTGITDADTTAVSANTGVTNLFYQ